MDMRTTLISAIRPTLGGAIWCGLLFGSAGTLDWPRAWAHVGLWLGAFAANGAVLARVNPEVLRLRLERDRFEKGWDRAMLGLLSLPVLAVPVLAGLDARHGWAPLAGTWAIPTGAALHVLGDAVLLAAMAVNRFAARTVRIQREAGHEVVTGGPYRVVRHPMYSGATLMLLGTPLVLGSAIALAPATCAALLLVVRTVREDRTLHEELPGYAGYAARTRSRLVPGIW